MLIPKPSTDRLAISLSLALAAGNLQADASNGTPANAVAPALNLLILESPASQRDERQTLEAWLGTYHCALSAVPSSRSELALENNPPPLHFNVYPSENIPGGLTLLARATTRDNTPLGTAWLIKSSTGITDIKRIENEHIAIGPEGAFLGREEPLRLLREAKVKVDTLTPFVSREYQGMMVLLLHGDVFSAAVPTPLAQAWAPANNLTVMLQSTQHYTGGIWGPENLSQNPCIQAFFELKKSGFKDSRFTLFPEWLTGFQAP